MAIRTSQAKAQSQFNSLNKGQKASYVRAANAAGAAKGYTSARHAAGMAAAAGASGG